MLYDDDSYLLTILTVQEIIMLAQNAILYSPMVKVRLVNLTSCSL